jgi:hypothetical protein
MSSSRFVGPAVALGTLLIVGALPSAADADRVIESAQARANGAWAGATMHQRKNGAVYATVNVGDTAADGVCAHGTIRWHHVNGSTYDDYGMHLCGAFTETDEPFRVPDRNWRAYEAIQVGAFVDGGMPVYTTILRWGDYDALHRQADRVMRMSYDDFTRYKRRVVDWPLNWTSNGCNWPADWANNTFRPACEQHDFGYRNYGKYMRFGRNETTRNWIDNRFKTELYRICDDKVPSGDTWLGCRITARAMYEGVSWGARRHFYGD